MHEDSLKRLKRQLQDVEQRLSAATAGDMGLELLELSAEMGLLAAELLAERGNEEERQLAMDTQLRMMEAFCRLNRTLGQELTEQEAQVQQRAEETQQALQQGRRSLQAAVQKHRDQIRLLEKTRQQLNLATLQLNRSKWAKPLGDD